ncbi:hypothetical protein DUI87_02343 [Hirundo rustica rustica]|uniref:Reverse transcriptase/retrotransposon-derived protein RNase H-like domain-containing protein n=1 Tax=Hirundo rustica rustica TaxID=333673 RepID=A0A3M0LQY6_HIRRU|nr:hypothetical protein DUI87_02343 [Hirundo rustica rustica]
MWRKLVRLGPQEYSSALAIIKRDETEETVLDMAKKLRTYADAVHGPTHARIAALETQVQGLADKMEENHKELKQDILQISAVQVRRSGTTRKRSLNKEGKGIPRAKILSENPSAVGLLKVEEQQVPIATSIVHRRQYRTTRDAVISIHKIIRELKTQVTRKKNNFHWGPEQQQAFAQIKQEIAHAVALSPVRTRPVVKKNVLYSAAGNNGLS